MKTLVKIDRNGTKTWMETDCPKCGGSGYIRGYEHVENGVCFKCGGSGKFAHTWVERTPEYEEKLRLRRLAKMKKEAPAQNSKFFKANGLSEDGVTWIAVGETYSIREQLKEAGAKFSSDFGWHFDHKPEGFAVAEFDAKQVMHQLENDWFTFNDNYTAEVEQFRKDNYPKTESKSEYVGQIGDRITVAVKCTGQHQFTTCYNGWSEEIVTIFIFEDKNENVFIWKTSTFAKIENGDQVDLKGTVKSHEEYKGTKQTVLTRCKVCA